METVQVDLICKSCGNTFQVKKMVATQLDVEVETRRIGKRRNPVCPNCFKQEKLAAAMEQAGKMGLPEIVGSTEKQIQFAFNLRSQYMERHPYKIQQARAELKAIREENIKPVTDGWGYKNEDDCIADAFRKIGLFEAYLCLTDPNASRLILVLKECP